jgi:putative phosphoesterase
MRLLVVGDTHGRIQVVQKALETCRGDILLCTGDFYNDGVKLARSLQIPFYGVTGNCDRGSASKEEQLLELGGRRVFLSHGHRYGVKRGLQSLYYRACEAEAELVLFGHTHVALCEKVEGIWLLNPGSPSLPRNPGRGSIAMVDLDQHDIVPRILWDTGDGSFAPHL